MSQANTDCIEDAPMTTLTRDQVEALADRLYSRSVSALSTVGPTDRQDLVLASRALRRFLSAYERGTGRQLSCIMLAGGR
jgi:hypothetical protein